jgi:hypothetical protein
MRDDSIVVAAELTGVLRHRCFYCSMKHTVKNTVRKCAMRFVEEVFGHPSVGISCNLNVLNRLDMAKRGELERADLYESLSGTVHHHANWNANWQDFVRCENVTEAYALAKAQLAEWRDSAFAGYATAMDAKNRCLTEFADLTSPAKQAVVRSPKPVEFTKEVDANSGRMLYKIAGRDVDQWQIVHFYRANWDNNKMDHAAMLADADLNRNILLWESSGYNPAGSRAPSTYSVSRFGVDGTLFVDKVKTKKPVEQY